MMNKALAIVLVVVIGGLAGCAGSTATKEQIQATGHSNAKKIVTSLIKVSIEGANYSNLSLFKGRLQKVNGVNKIYQLSFSVEEASLLQVEYEGAAQSLADAIQGLATENMPIEILRFDPTSVRIRIGGSM